MINRVTTILDDNARRLLPTVGKYEGYTVGPNALSLIDLRGRATEWMARQAACPRLP